MVPYFPDALQTWDINVLNWIQEHICNPILDVLFPIITVLGDKGLFFIAIAVVYYFYPYAFVMPPDINFESLLNIVR